MADGFQFDIGEWWVVFVAFGIPVIYFIYVMIVCYCDVRKQKKLAKLALRKQMHGQSNPIMARPNPSSHYMVDEDLSPEMPRLAPGVHRSQKNAMKHSSSANNMQKSSQPHQSRRSNNAPHQSRRGRNMHV